MPNVSIGARVGHVHFMLFVSVSFALGSQRKRGFQWNMGSFTFALSSQHSFRWNVNFNVAFYLVKPIFHCDAKPLAL